MKLSEVRSDDNLKVLVYGNSGSGKTCYAAGFPTPILYLDFDGKVDSAANYYAKDARLEEIEVRDLSKKMSSDPIEELIAIIDKELIPQEKAGAMKYKTIVLDSLTTFSSLCLSHIMRTNPGVKRTVSKQGAQACLQDYGILKREFEKLIPGLLSLPCNIVMLGHIDTAKDELTGELVRGPLMDGSFAKQLSIYFKEVYRSYVEGGKHLLQTKSDYRYACRSQIKGVPDPMPMAYSEIEKAIRA